MTRSPIQAALAACAEAQSAAASAASLLPAEERLSVKLRPAERHLLVALAEERGESMTAIIRRGLALVAAETTAKQKKGGGK